MSGVVALVVGMVVGLVVVNALPYANHQKPIFPICITCHNDLSEVSASTPYWYRVNGSTVCIDHAKMDGAKFARLFPDLLKSSPELPPDKFLCRKRMSDLVVKGFSKYEVFCAHVGRKLQAQNPKLLTMRHTIVDHTDKRFVFFHTRSTWCVDAPIARCVKLSTRKKSPFVPTGAVQLLRHLYGPENKAVVYVKDWRFLHRIKVNVNRPGTDMYGNDNETTNGNLFVTILMTSDTYYAVVG